MTTRAQRPGEVTVDYFPYTKNLEDLIRQGQMLEYAIRWTQDSLTYVNETWQRNWCILWNGSLCFQAVKKVQMQFLFS